MKKQILNSYTSKKIQILANLKKYFYENIKDKEFIFNNNNISSIFPKIIKMN